jgi:acyl-CoA thioester hydrolase
VTTVRTSGPARTRPGYGAPIEQRGHLLPWRVQFRDLDPYAHVNHAVYVTWFEIARTEALRDMGILLAGPHASGYQFVITEMAIRYRGAAVADDLVSIETAIVEIRGASTRWRQKVWRDDVVLVEGDLRVGLLGPNQRPARMPETMRGQLDALYRPAPE